MARSHFLAIASWEISWAWPSDNLVIVAPDFVTHAASRAPEINRVMRAHSSESQHSVFKGLFTVMAITRRWMVWISRASEWLELYSLLNFCCHYSTDMWNISLILKRENKTKLKDLDSKAVPKHHHLFSLVMVWNSVLSFLWQKWQKSASNYIQVLCTSRLESSASWRWLC